MKRAWLTLLIGAAALGVPASAHHSFAAHYLEDQSVSIEGDLVQFEYRNPHAWVQVTAKDESGAIRQVSAEWASAARLKQWENTADGLFQEPAKSTRSIARMSQPARLSLPLHPRHSR